ncbi:MAG: helix-turn-helix domain-containing protein [Chloroflexota bacterium]
MTRTTPAPDLNHRVDRAIETIQLIGDRWSVPVIHYLIDNGIMRFGELERAVGNISPGVLTKTLRTLERNGIVERKVYPVIPPRVEYSVTPLGESLKQPMKALCNWSEKHYDRVNAARDSYDSKQSQSTSM